MSLPSSSPPPRVVRVEWPERTIAVVVLEDRASRNSFSPAFIEGVTHAFGEIASNPEARVVVVHGYDSYFCCGGTKEELLLLAEGKAKFTDFTFYDLMFRCEIPVVAALQGHAIGAGLVFGCYADVLVLAEESLYSANFMRYGFTPGMGATCVIPRRFGLTLGWEMLLTGRSYHGGELRTRGAQVSVVRRTHVVAGAMETARELADKPLVALKELKRRWVDSFREELASAVRKEVEMHRVTFPLPEVRERIARLTDPGCP